MQLFYSIEVPRDLMFALIFEGFEEGLDDRSSYSGIRSIGTYTLVYIYYSIASSADSRINNGSIFAP
jgi:hypothetical protein